MWNFFHGWERGLGFVLRVLFVSCSFQFGKLNKLLSLLFRVHIQLQAQNQLQADKFFWSDLEKTVGKCNWVLAPNGSFNVFLFKFDFDFVSVGVGMNFCCCCHIRNQKQLLKPKPKAKENKKEFKFVWNSKLDL